MLKPKTLPPQAELKEFFDFDWDTGVLSHRSRPLSLFPDERTGKTWNTKFAGKEAGRLRPSGYRTVSLYGSICQTHRIVYKWVTGLDIEDTHLDHIDSDRSNNRFHNLQPITQQQNVWKQSERNRNTSSVYKGVSWHKASGKWISYISVDNKKIHLGLFTSELEAHRAYCLAALERFGEFGEFANFGESSPFTRESLRA
jgi:hypothetical protein